MKKASNPDPTFKNPTPPPKPPTSSRSGEAAGCVQKTWKIKRWITEEFEVQAATRKEALERTDGPYAITVTKETCVPT